MALVQEVKERLDIVEIVSGYVPLQKAGRSFKAVCPFHSEKTPSFFVFPERQTWHCFGSCGSGGDVFAFVMRREGIDFGEALRRLAERAGIAIGSERRGGAEQDREARLRDANEVGAQFYHTLLVGSPTGAAAREYLAGRGMARRTVQDFMLGYSPESWDALGSHLRERGYEDEELIAAGLVMRNEETGSIYDRFRGRLMFPIRDDRGRMVGFGARALDSSEPKYLNSPQSALFDKSGILYALDRAREAIRREGRAVVVEGYMDALAAHEHGIHNVVASMGTSLTERQVRLLHGMTHNIVLALDADAAGDEATLRGIEVVRDALGEEVVAERTRRGLRHYRRSSEIEVRAMVLPRGKDPDEIIREDARLWGELVEKALPVTDYIFQAIAGRFDLASAAERSRAAEELLKAVGALDDPVQQAHYLQRLARLVQVDERTLQERLRAMRREGRRLRQARGEESPAPAPERERDLLEEFCLAVLLRNPELLAEPHDLAADDFLRSENREVFLGLTEADLGLQDLLGAGLGDHLEELISMQLPAMDAGLSRRALADVVARLHKRRLQQMKAQEGFLLAEAADGAEESTRISFSRWRSGPVSGKEEIDHLVELQEKGMELNARLKEVFQRLDRKTRTAEVDSNG
ncbi:MAG: DNA primase [Chloroflexi bacterium]|nr:DNA primase [Chloroflexota bacterium]